MKNSLNYSHHGQLTLENMNQARWYNKWTVNIFKKYLKGEILEIGCGIGNFTKTLVPYGNVFSFDVDIYCVNKTKKKIKQKTAQIGFGDIETGHYFFKNKKFDAIVCMNVLEHITNDQNALINMTKLLKTEGSLILLIPAHPLLYGKIDEAIGHYRRYEKKDIIRRIKELGLEIICGKRINFFGAIGWFIAGKIFKNTSVSQRKLKLFEWLAPFILPVETVIEPPLGTSILIIAKKLPTKAI